MRHHLLLVVLLLQMITGCALPVRSPEPLPVAKSGEAALWKMRLEKDGKERYAGLLAINTLDEGLQVVLMDATGITLLTGRLDQEGRGVDIRALPVVHDKGLPGYLVRALRRIFFIAPDQEPCAWQGIVRLCLQPGSGTLVKEAHFGFIPLWRVDYTEPEREVGSHQGRRIIMHGSWFEPDLILEPL